jgi:pimeloyl-ACP methyl ester carboxylesterase
MELHVQEYGEGSPLLILHGLFGASDNWHSLAQRFGAFFHVYSLDLRNHGKSPWSEDNSYAAMSEDVHAFILSRDLKKVIVLGHSMGGKVAMHVAQQYPELLSKIVIADMGIKAYPMHHQHILAGIHALPLAELSSRSEAEALLKTHVENAGIRQFLLKNLYWKEKGKLAWRMNVEVLEKEMPKILSALPLQECWTPALFLRGELSNYILPEDFDSIETLFPDASIETITNAGHWLHAEQPDLFFDAVMRFCLG